MKYIRILVCVICCIFTFNIEVSAGGADISLYFYTKEATDFSLKIDHSRGMGTIPPALMGLIPPHMNSWEGTASPPNELHFDEDISSRRIFGIMGVEITAVYMNSNTGWSVAGADLEKWARDWLGYIGFNLLEIEDFVRVMKARFEGQFYEIYYLYEQSKSCDRILDSPYTFAPETERVLKAYFAFKEVPQRRLIKPVNRRHTRPENFSRNEYHRVEWGIVYE